MYAIVDIETTGGYAAAGGITEIAVQLHDGRKVVKDFQTLINPQQPIPRYIQALTGITPAMVEDAPCFADVAEQLFALLEGNIFVAHNVNFDFSFLKYQLEQEGYRLDVRKLCTVRLSRQIIPGLPSYSLGNLCRHLHIPISQRHRAGGDLDATVKLFEYLLQHDQHRIISRHLQRASREQYLPLKLPKEIIDNLPQYPGVYYFHNDKGKVIYVGKAKHIRKRVVGHFTHHDTGSQRQAFLRDIAHVSFQVCPNELCAHILECVEIKRLWPAHNYSQKRFEQAFGLYAFDDQRGYTRLGIDKKNKSAGAPLHTFYLLADDHSLLRKLIREFRLCPKLCFLQTGQGTCAGLQDHTCYGACEYRESPADYNKRVQEALSWLQDRQSTMAIITHEPGQERKSCVLLEKGCFYGMGYLPESFTAARLADVKPHLTRYPDHFYIRNMICKYADEHPEAVFSLQE